MMKLNILFGCILILFCSHVKSLGENCYTPNNELAKCVPYNDCKTFSTIHENNWTRSMEFFLRRSIKECPGSENVVVCCGTMANFKHMLTIETTTQPAITETEKLTTETITQPAITDTEKEKLLYLNECGEGGQADKIVGGNSTVYDEFPWMTLLQYNHKAKNILQYQCGGSLINDRYVLTAAHCLVGQIQQIYDLVKVRVGDWNYTSPKDCQADFCNEPIDVDFEEIIPHENYLSPNNKQNKYHDIGLIRLKTKLQFDDFIKPICLPKNDDKINKNEILQIAGWGIYDTHSRSSSDVLLKANVKINKNCKKFYKTLDVQFSNNQICAGGADNVDSCQGDSGGPLMRISQAKYHAVGVVSFGPNPCGQPGWPSIYTKVFNYIDWIKKHIRP